MQTVRSHFYIVQERPEDSTACRTSIPAEVSYWRRMISAPADALNVGVQSVSFYVIIRSEFLSSNRIPLTRPNDLRRCHQCCPDTTCAAREKSSLVFEFEQRSEIDRTLVPLVSCMSFLSPVLRPVSDHRMIFYYLTDKGVRPSLRAWSSQGQCWQLRTALIPFRVLLTTSWLLESRERGILS